MKSYPTLAIFIVFMYAMGILTVLYGAVLAAMDNNLFYLLGAVVVGAVFVASGEIIKLFIDMRKDTQRSADVLLWMYQQRKPKKSTVSDPRIRDIRPKVPPVPRPPAPPGWSESQKDVI